MDDSEKIYTHTVTKQVIGDCQREDRPIAGQKFACLSFISPEDVIKKKELFFFEQFLKSWEPNKAVEKFSQFLNFVSFKYKLSYNDLSDDFKDYMKTETADIKSSLNVTNDYKTFTEVNGEALQTEYDIQHKFQTNTRGLKVRGVYSSREEADMRGKLLRESDPAFSVHVGTVGAWLTFNNDAKNAKDVDYMEQELNTLIHEKNKNDELAKTEFEDRVRTARQDAINENREKAKATGNTLTQTINDQGELTGMGNTSQEASLASSFGGDANSKLMSTKDVCDELFEGDNIVTGDTDHGQSRLTTGPLALNK